MNKESREYLLTTLKQRIKPNIVDLISSNKPDALSKIKQCVLSNKPMACVVYVHKELQANQSFLIRWFQLQTTAAQRLYNVPMHCGYLIPYTPLECQAFLNEYASKPPKPLKRNANKRSNQNEA